ncbi:uncharacterized protein LOC125047224 isoform X3 [Penaeus chinensis]|uniref:uncharacterized protein LOC125047224 isoform X3 n=1 Tax=Penaeus chinensis TaxID=139456 RepID=UPI001FB83309|nr:uncharacterized protein LOC125047224 isoform X3 [Penaeus chinensis]
MLVFRVMMPRDSYPCCKKHLNCTLFNLDRWWWCCGAMGCVVSFIRSLRSYHGSHLTPRQLERQRRQRSQKAQSRPTRAPTPPSSPEEDERRALSFDGGYNSYSTTPPPPSAPPAAAPTPKSKRPKLFKSKS